MIITILTIFISRLAERLLRLLGRGATTLPGRIALKLKPNILSYLSKDVCVIMITGTNGKTTTARIVEQGFKSSGKSYFLNRSGANLITGITTAFLANCNALGKCKKAYAIIECDENALKKVSLYVKAKILVVTNVFRDQLDRFGEVSHTLSAIKTGAENMPDCLLVLNADDPLTFSLSRLSNAFASFGIDVPLSFGGSEDNSYCVFCRAPYKYSFRTYSQLGGFFCPKCGYRRKEPSAVCTDILSETPNDSHILAKIGSTQMLLRVNLGSVYNIYNALAAAQVLYSLGFSQLEIENALAAFNGAFGRMESFGSLRMLLVKNPAGFTQTMNYINMLEVKNLVFVLNDNDADGRDVSWIWDAELSINPSVENIYTFGIRSGDMALRLKYAGYKPQIIRSYKEFYALCGEENTVLVPTYTAMMALRPFLAEKFKKEEFWR